MSFSSPANRSLRATSASPSLPDRYTSVWWFLFIKQNIVNFAKIVRIMKLTKIIIRIRGFSSKTWDFINKHSVLSGTVATVLGGLILIYLTSDSSQETIKDEAIYYDAGEVPDDRAVNATEEYSKLRKLAPGVPISNFRDLLGKEMFVNNLSSEVIEYVFVNPLYYVEAATDINNNVLFYSITTRKVNFNPKFEFFNKETNSNEVIIVTLGKTTFSELDKIFYEPTYATYSTGANKFYYFEAYYPGRPYQTHIFSMNQSGVHGKWPIITSYDKSLYQVIDNRKMFEGKTFNNEWSEYRKSAVINTYTVTAPFYGIDEIVTDLNKEFFGPNFLQVRLVN